jgi:hypothetical protein
MRGRSAVWRHTKNLLTAKSTPGYVALVEDDCPACGLAGVAMPMTRAGKSFYLVTCAGNRRVDVTETQVEVQDVPQSGAVIDTAHVAEKRVPLEATA